MVHTHYLGILALPNGLPGNGMLPGQDRLVRVSGAYKSPIFPTRASPRPPVLEPVSFHQRYPFNQLCMLLAIIDLQVI